MDCRGHDHRSARAQIPLQRSGDKGELKLDTANSALDRKAAFESERANANAVNSRSAGQNEAWLTFRGARAARALAMAASPLRTQTLLISSARSARHFGEAAEMCTRAACAPRRFTRFSRSARRLCCPTRSTNRRS